MIKRHWFEILLIIAVMSMSVYAALSDAQNFSLRWFTRDDAYYYFKVAQNISEGHGSTFDGVNKTNGYHPLWMLVCIPIFALARFDLVLPLRILLLVMSALQVSTAIMLFRLLGKVFAPAIGAIAALFWVFSFDILVNIYQQGLESGIAAFFIVLLVYKLYEFEQSWRKNQATAKQLAALGLVAALTIFSRLDLVFLAAFAGLWIVFRGHLLRFFLPFDLIAVISSVFLAFILRLDLPEYYDFSKIAVIMVALALGIKLIAAYFFGLYQRRLATDFRHFALRLIAFAVTTSALLGGAMLAIAQLGNFAGFPRTAIALDFAVTLLFFGSSRLIFIIFRTSPNTSEPSPLLELRANAQTWIRDGLAYFGVAFGLLGVYMLWSKFSFGTFSPVSGQIKRWWGSFPARVYGGATRSPLEFFGIDYQGEGLAWTPIVNTLGEWAQRSTRMTAEANQRYVYLLILTCIVALLILFFNKAKSKTAVTQLSLIPLFCASILQAVYYHSSGYSAYKEWYWITQRITAVIALCLIVGILYSLTRKIQFRQYVAWALALWFGFTIGQDYWAGIRNVMRYDRWSADTPMMEIATLLEANTEPGSLIGFTGGGNVGYFIQGRTIVNMDGLINSAEYFHALQNGTAGEFLANIGLDYVLANPSILNRQPYDGQFNDYLTPTDILYGGKQLMKYDSDK
ncbi:MAG: hypothetical protein IT314_07600 [Anaerolineales bacterium]|nr:hypothetical protein [Anaerolineales bacterium]